MTRIWRYKMTPEKKLAYIITNVEDALEYSQKELGYYSHITFKFTGFGTYCTSKFLDKFIRKMKIVTQEADEEKKIPERYYYAYSITGLKRLLKDKWFLEKLLETVYSTSSDHLNIFKTKIMS